MIPINLKMIMEVIVEAIIQDHVLEVNDMQMKLKYGASVLSESNYKSQHK